MPGGFPPSQDAREEDHADRQPEAATGNPRPPTYRQPSGDDFIPRQFGGFELGGLAHETEVLAGGLIERVQPEGLFPG